MSAIPDSVERWKEVNGPRLIECRWGLKLTSEACRAYQTRTCRSVLHFNGDTEPLRRANAEYARCLLPDPCPNALPDEEALAARTTRTHLDHSTGLGRRVAQLSRKRRRCLTSPDSMLQEADWKRSLIR